MRNALAINVILWICIALVVAIVCNVFAVVHSKPLVPVQYTHRVHTMHYKIEPPDMSVKYLEFKDYTGLNDYSEVKPEPAPEVKVLVKEIDPDLIMTASVCCVILCVVGFVMGYGARLPK